MPPYISPEAKDLMRKLLKVCTKMCVCVCLNNIEYYIVQFINTLFISTFFYINY